MDVKYTVGQNRPHVGVGGHRAHHNAGFGRQVGAYGPLMVKRWLALNVFDVQIVFATQKNHGLLAICSNAQSMILTKFTPNSGFSN